MSGITYIRFYLNLKLFIVIWRVIEGGKNKYLISQDKYKNIKKR